MNHPKLVSSPVHVLPVWDYTRAELITAANLCFPVGPSDGQYLMKDVEFKVEEDFDNKEEIITHLGFPIGSIHSYCYGLMGEGLHTYKVVSVVRELRIDPRDKTVYGMPRYIVKMEFYEDLTPDNFWSVRAAEQGITQSCKYESFECPRNTLYGSKRLDIDEHRVSCWYAATYEGAKIPDRVLNDHPLGSILKDVSAT